MKILFLLFLLIFSSLNVMFASVVEDISVTRGQNIPNSVMENIVAEKIRQISLSKRILIITNLNKSFSKGDFISLILHNTLVARAIAAKDVIEKQLGGIKIVKIYNTSLYNTFRRGMEVMVLRGDDSYFLKQLENIGDETDPDLIKDEEDLYNDTNLLETDDDVTMDENKKRAIKTDNIVGMSYGQMESIGSDGGMGRESHYMAYWGFQIEDNIWLEANIGQTIVKDYPTGGLDTRLTNFTVRGKYTITAPFYSYLMPYIGYQIVTPDSPGAGKDDGETSDADLNTELDLVEDLKKSHIIFGATILKRLVPGWFARLDLGTDVMAFGFALEF